MTTTTKDHKVREVRISTYTNNKLGTTHNYGAAPSSIDVVRGTSEIDRNGDKDWRVKLAKGVGVTNSYSRKEYRYIKPLHAQAYGHTKTATLDRSCKCLIRRAPGTQDMFVGEKTEVREAALNKLKRKLQSHYGDMNLMTPLAELKDLRGTLLNTARFTSDFMRKLLSLRRRTRKSSYRYAGDLWLNFNFGVLPLIGDTAKAAASIQDYLDRSDHTFRIVGQEDTDWVSSNNELGYTGLQTATLNTNIAMKHTLSYKYVGGFSTTVRSANDYGVLRHLGFTFENIIPTAWELVPYSWVMDYFTTAGAYFSDTFVLPPGNLKYLVLNRRYTCKGVLKPLFVPSQTSGNFVDSTTYQDGGFEYFEFSRVPLSTLPRQTLRFKTVDEMGLNAVKKLLNLTSLLPRR